MRGVRVLLVTCFALVVSVLLLDLLLTDRLPQAMFGREVFWHQIPPVIAYGENILWVVIIAVPLLIPLRCRPIGSGRLRRRAGALPGQLGGLADLVPVR
jgi:hypothetical protein